MSYPTASFPDLNFHLGDRRLNRRAASCLRQLLSRDMTKGFPRIFEDQHQLKAFYRLMNNPKTTPQKLIRGSWDGLANYFQRQYQASGSPVVIKAYQDSTAGKFSERKKLDLGYLQTNSKRDNGVFIHTTIACDQQGHPRGIFDQQFIQRQRGEFGKKKDRKTRPFEDKESFKWVAWLEGLKQWREQLDYPVKIMTIADREGDVAEVINALVKDDFDFIIRSSHNRNTASGTDKLHDLLKQSQPLESFVDTRRLHTRQSGKYYEAECRISYGTFQLRGIDQPLQAVHLKECQANADQQQAEWFVLTSCELSSPEQARQVVDDYQQRWPITEDFHMSLKTGAKMEKRQFDTAPALFNAIAMLSLAALRIMAMRYVGQSNGEQPLEESGLVSDPIVYDLLPQLSSKYLKGRDFDFCQPGTVQWFHILIARMGGHQGYAQKGRPGWRILWEGYLELERLVAGARLYKQSTYG